MRESKKKRLQGSGWTIGSAVEFLGLTPEESTFIDLKLRLAGGLRESRESMGMTQKEVALAIGSSQSRVAKMEAADPSVSVDLLIRTMLALGASATDVARAISPPKKRAA